MYTGRRTAELSIRRQRLSSTKITFINEIADLAERAGAEVQEVARGIGLDNGSAANSASRPRASALVLPQDTRALVKTAQIMVCHCASSRPCSRSTIAQARDGAQGRGDARRQSAQQDIGVLGLAFKPEYRRHARSTLDPTHHRATGPRCYCAGL